MRGLQYLLKTVVFALVYVFAMFFLPYLSMVFGGQQKLMMFIGLAVVLGMEYIYLWFAVKGSFFALPLSFLWIFLFGLFYFNLPGTPDMGLGMWVLAQKLVLPYAAGSAVLSGLLFWLKKKERIQQ